MLDSVRSFVTSHNDVSKVVRDAEKFSVRLPLVGRVGVPPPRHLAFYVVLGALAGTEVIPWPVAVGIGLGHALTVRASAATEAAEEVSSEAPEAEPVSAPSSTPDGEMATTP